MTLASTVLVLAGLLAGAALLWRLPTVPTAGRPGLAGTVSVVIPARDEEHSLPRLLASLAAQDPPPLEVIVVDDASTDATGRVAIEAGASVISMAPDDLPVGWLGKPWACSVGASAAAGERLLFLDADTWLAPDAVDRLCAAQAAHASDGLLSVQPFHAVERSYEHLSAVCNLVPVMASGMAAPGRPRSSRVAFGPCLLTTAAALQAVGGFGAVRDRVVEDAALARAYCEHGRTVRVLGGGDAVRFRMYPGGLRSLVEGWTKNLAGGAALASPLATVGAVLWVWAGASITVDALLHPGPAVAVAWIAFALELHWMLRRLGSFAWWVGALFPAPLLCFIALFVRSLVVRLTGRRVTWRGRRIDARRGTID